MTGFQAVGRADRYVLSGGGCKWSVATYLVLGAVLPLIVFLRARPPTSVLVWLVWPPLIFGVSGYRWIRACVVVEPDLLTLRTPFRTRRLDWAQVRSARIAPTNANRLFACVEVTTVSGRRIKVDGVASPWRRRHLQDSPVGRAVAMINERAQGLPGQEAPTELGL